MAVAAHFTWSVVGKKKITASVIVPCFGNLFCPSFFSYIDAVSCWQKRGKNLSTASSCRVHDKIELWVNGAFFEPNPLKLILINRGRMLECTQKCTEYLLVLFAFILFKITKSCFVSRLQLTRMDFQARGMVMIPCKQYDKTPAEP